MVADMLDLGVNGLHDFRLQLLEVTGPDTPLVEIGDPLDKKRNLDPKLNNGLPVPVDLPADPTDLSERLVCHAPPSLPYTPRLVISPSSLSMDCSSSSGVEPVIRSRRFRLFLR